MLIYNTCNIYENLINWESLIKPFEYIDTVSVRSLSYFSFLNIRIYAKFAPTQNCKSYGPLSNHTSVSMNVQ